LLEADQQVPMLGTSTFYDGLAEIVFQDSMIYMADNSPRIYRLNPKLKVLKQIYNIGKGPGEFTSITDIDYKNDSLYVFTRSQRKIIVYDSTSKFVRELSVKNITGQDMAIIGNKIYLSAPFAEKPIIKLDFSGNKIQAFGQKTADQESYNIYRNERILLSYDNSLIAVSPSKPIVRTYNLDGDLISEKRIEHPLLKDRIDYVEEFHSKPASNGALGLAFLFRDAVIFNNKLFVIAHTSSKEQNESNFAFVLAFDLKENGQLSYSNEYKLFRPDRNNRLFGIDLGFVNDNTMLIYDLTSKNIFLFKDESI
jgi:hypothetical protein